MRTETDIRAGITSGEELIKDELANLIAAVEAKDYFKVVEISGTITFAALAIASVNDACFGGESVNKADIINEFFNLNNKK